MKRSSVFAAIAVLVLVFSPVAVAQVITGTIIGTVSDETGAVLPGVEITVRNQDTGISRSVVSNDEGSYRAQSLALGPYEVRAELAGFQTAIRTGIGLTVGQQAVVNLELRVGEITEQVFVTGEASLVETTRSTVSDLVDQRKIRDLPLNGRDFTQLALLQAGVINSISSPRSQIGNEGVKITIAGTRITQTAMLLDGTDIRNELNTTPGGASGALLGVETVREFQVITGVFSAEYGKFTGGVINAVSKSGTNEIHGSIFEFHRNSALDARNFFDRDPDNPLVRSDPPGFKRNQFGFTLGGPVKKDQTFFFGSYEGLRERLANTTIQGVPNALAHQGFLPIGPGGSLVDVGVAPEVQPYLDLYPLPNSPKDRGGGKGEFLFAISEPTNEDFFMVKVDHQFSDADSFFVRYTFSQGDRFVLPRLPLFGQDAVYRNQWTTLEWKRIISPALINELRFGYTRSKHHVIPVDMTGTDPSLRFIPTPPRVFGEITISGGVVTLGPSHNQFKTNVFNNYQTTDNLIYTKGRHALKFGVDWHHTQFNFLNFSRASGIYAFTNLESFLRGQPRSFDGFINDFSTVGMRQNLIGLYVQDDITAKPNLTVNLGLRYEFITEPTEVAGRLGNMLTPLDPEVRLGNPYFKNPSLKNFSPRIGFAWDPFGNGKTSVRGGFGLFFDQILTNYYSAPIQQSPPNIRVTLDFPRDKEDNFPNDFFTLPPLDQIKLGPWVIFDPVQPYIMQYSLNLQRELFPNAVLTLGYTGSRGVHLGRFLDANTAFGERQADGRWFFEAGLPRRNPVFGRMRATVWDASSWYNAMRVSFQKRFSQGYQFQISYNFSRMIDEGNGTSFFDRGSRGDSTQMTFFDDVHMDRGLSGFNTSHSFTANYTVELPGENLTGALGQILGGWTASGIMNAASGETMTLTMSFDRARLLTGNRNLRPDAVPGVDPVVGNLPDNYFGEPEDVKNAFTVPERGYFGNLGRGTVTGPDRFTLDFALLKKTKLTEGADLQFRAEMFNILNNVNFSNPGSRVFDRSSGRVSSSFGISSSTVNTSRQIQFALKILF